MKKPELHYNYYYPYYTQKIVGEKKYYYRVETVVHLSEKKGILLSISYKSKKLYEVEISELDSSRILFDKKDKGELIHYTSFAKEVSEVFRCLSSALNALSSCKPYIKKIIFGTYLKYNSDIEFELEYKKIKVSFDKIDYVIEDGRKKRKEPDTSYIDETMEKLKSFVSAIDEKTTYTELDPAVFDKELNYYWEYFIEFFKCPKFIKKSEYLPK